MSVQGSGRVLEAGTDSMAASDCRDSGAECGPDFTYASVFISGVETGYERAGVGRPVILLVSDPVARMELSRSLSVCNRVIVPDIASVDETVVRDTVPGCDWLRGLLIGLGIEMTRLVMDAAWSVAGLSLAVAEPERIDRLAFVVDGAAGSMPEAGIEDMLSSTGQRLFMVPTRSAGDLSECVSRIEAFFGGETA